jgi:hypothetical protein
MGNEKENSTHRHGALNFWRNGYEASQVYLSLLVSLLQ